MKPSIRSCNALTTLPKVLVAAALAFATFALPGQADAKDPKDYKFALALGWSEGESGQHLLRGYKDAVKKLGGTLTVVDAAYDAKRQSDQIDALVKTKPDALFVSASDPAAIAPAVRRAIEAGIPVFASDSLIPGTPVTSTAMSNNFGMGAYTAEYIAKRLGGKGNIALVDLPANETWDMRAQGLYWALTRYPDIKVVATWSYNSTGNMTARQGVETLLTGNPKLDAIWCAWDGAAMEGGLAIKAAGRQGIFTTGIDGGKQVFTALKAETGVALSMAQTFYEMAYLNVSYAHQFIAGKKVPRIVITPVYAVTKGDLPAAIPDDYDIPGNGERLGWKRAL
jgi:ribose transport system substrate-binding protein